MNGRDLEVRLRCLPVSKRQLAEAIGISEQNLSNKLKSDDIKVSLLEKISEAFHLPMTWFFDDTDNVFQKTNEIVVDRELFQFMKEQNIKQAEEINRLLTIIEDLSSQKGVAVEDAGSADVG